jgi:hypothetical protein
LLTGLETEFFLENSVSGAVPGAMRETEFLGKNSVSGVRWSIIAGE